MKSELYSSIDFTAICSLELFEYISFKDEFPEDAKKAFQEFVNRFERDVLQKAEIYCKGFNFNETIALDVAHCTFARVWKYPKFDVTKSNGKNIETSIKSYLYRIIYTQILNYKKNDFCAEPTLDEDLTIVNNYIEFVEKWDVEDKKEIMIKFDFINSALLNLSEKHKIIYFTYKAYENDFKVLPKTIREQLKTTLNLTQSTIRVYKKDAYEAVNNYINQRNGKR